MENATKALLIAGGILLTLMVISIGVYLFASYRDFAEKEETTVSTNSITEFNSNFTKFIGRNDITAQEIVSLVNFVVDYNNKNGTNIAVNVSDKPNIDTFELEELTNFILEKNENEQKYTCQEGNIIYDAERMVSAINFQ